MSSSLGDGEPCALSIARTSDLVKSLFSRSHWEQFWNFGEMEVERVSSLPRPFFSIVIPTYDRVINGKLRRCLNSVEKQTYPNFEAVIVDDGSKEDVKGLVESYDDRRFKYVRTEHSGRVMARNAGMAAAQGQWISWLDSDDALDAICLQTLLFNIRGRPEVKLWVHGVVVHGMIKEGDVHLVPKHTHIRQAWKPPLNRPEDRPPVHKFFTSGKVGTGMFVFAKECLEKTGLMPAWENCYDIADGIHRWTGYLMDPPFYSAALKWVGNPNGEDHAFFLKLCRFYEVHLIKAALYTQYTR